MTTIGLPPQPGRGPGAGPTAAAVAPGHDPLGGLKHYEQTTQAMALKDRRKPVPAAARSKKPMRSLNPNEVAIPEGLKPDEKDRLLQEIKKKWQADFGQRIRMEESNRTLREQLARMAARVEELEGAAGSAAAPGGTGETDEGDGPASDGPSGDAPHSRPTKLLAPGARAAKARIRRNDSDFRALNSQLRRVTSKLPAAAGGANGTAAAAAADDNMLRQTNVIVVLTRRNKELLADRKRYEEMLHLKTVAAEAEVRRAEKLERALELERQKTARDRTKLEAALVDAGRAKTSAEDKVRELERRLEYAGRVRIALEHQIGGLREKLDALMINYSDVVMDIPDEDAFITASRKKKEDTTGGTDDNGPVSEEEKLKQARLALEYEAWVKKKKEEAAHAYPGVLPRSRKHTKEHAEHQGNDGKRKHDAEVEAERKRQEAEAAERARLEEEARQRAEEEARRKEQEELERAQHEAEERERERARRAEEELARQEADERRQQEEEEAKKKKSGWKRKK